MAPGRPACRKSDSTAPQFLYCTPNFLDSIVQFVNQCYIDFS